MREKKYDVEYKGSILPHNFYADFVVYEDIILEVKSVKEVTSEHLSRTLNYMKLADTPIWNYCKFSKQIINSQKID